MHITIDARFNGPPTSGNGGYVCGAVAEQLGGEAEVTLRAPPPLATPLTFEDGALKDGATVLAEARRAPLDLAPPEPPSFDEAARAAEHYVGKHNHPYATCFVCGPKRAQGDGLRIFPGALEKREVVAAPWVPTASMLGSDDRVTLPIVWASLDCPGFFGMYTFAQTSSPLWLLGRLAARVSERPRADEKCVVVGWMIGRDGRKAHTGSALFGERGDLYGVAQGTWIELKPKA
jgi:hypothetical protein